jgi:hypothetical protein
MKQLRNGGIMISRGKMKNYEKTLLQWHCAQRIPPEVSQD